MFVRRSVGPSVRRSVGPSVRWSVGPSVRGDPVEKWKNVIDTFCVCLCVGGGDWGVDGGWMPLPTRPQRYCDPESFVLIGNYTQMEMR